MESINVTVTGGTEPQKELVSNVISRALTETGFSNVALVNTKGEPMAAYEVPSLLGHIQERNPDFLTQPVRVWAIPNSGADFEPMGDLEDGIRAKSATEAEEGFKMTVVTLIEGDLEAAAGRDDGYQFTNEDDNALREMREEARRGQAKQAVREVVKEAARIALVDGKTLGPNQIERAVKNALESEDLIAEAGL